MSDTRDYMGTTAGAFAPRDEPCAPAQALDSIASSLDEIEARLRKTGSYATGMADRIFGTPVPLNQVSSKGESPIREQSNIPAIMNRLERIHMAIGEIDGAHTRFASL